MRAKLEAALFWERPNLELLTAGLALAGCTFGLAALTAMTAFITQHQG